VIVARRNAGIVERRYGIRPKRSRRKAIIDYLRRHRGCGSSPCGELPRFENSRNVEMSMRGDSAVRLSHFGGLKLGKLACFENSQNVKMSLRRNALEATDSEDLNRLKLWWTET
jgi:hypothetical protein